MTGVYISLITGLTYVFGWERLLEAAGLDPEGFGEVLTRYATWIQQYYDALAETSVPVIYSHDDMVWTSGAIFHPEWYRRYVFPNYRRLCAPLVESGKRVIFVCDGDYTGFVDDIAACGVHGFFFEPLTSLECLVERYGQTHVLIGNVDTRTLLSGPRSAIRAEVERCLALGKGCPGFFLSVSNMIPPNTPVANALCYNEVYEELCRR
jgi:uroporphyrinogen-III decarboxylase